MSKKNRQTRRQQRATIKEPAATTEPAPRTRVLDNAAYTKFVQEVYPDQLAVAKKQQVFFDSLPRHQRLSVLTKHVKRDKLLSVSTPLMDVCLKPVCITVTPECQSLMCHQNADFVEQTLGWACKVGFNAHSCRCGACTTFELHSVNINDVGDYVDFTTDFNSEKHKWFIPFRSTTPISLLTKLLPAPLIYSAAGKVKCTCGGGKNPGAPPIDFVAVKRALTLRVLAF